MSDDPNYEDEPQENPNMRQLRDKAKRADDAEKRASDAERALAFATAGVDLADPRVTKYFVPQYDGELTRDAIRAAAEQDGFLNTPAPQVPPVPDPVPLQEQQAINRMSSATEGASAPPPPNILDEWRELAQRGQRENWSPEMFSMELAKNAHRNGLPVEMDGYDFVPPTF